MSCYSSFNCCSGKKSALDHELLEGDENNDSDNYFNSPISPPIYAPPDVELVLTSDAEDLHTLSDTLKILSSANCQDHPDVESYFAEHISHQGALKVKSTKALH